MQKFKSWFKKHKKLLLIVAVAVGGPPAAVYVHGAGAAIELSEVVGE